ncbi:MAG: helix-turn-helix protein [Candidatus Izimaplasma bacterium HR2]|nr:MAG: helix-turn-helix protein [Candidatus Izimaplasma bacterium HR2]
MPYKSVGKYMKMVRTKKGLTQEDLAEAAKISRQAIGQSEKKGTYLKAPNYVGVSNKLDVSIGEILRSGRRRKTEVSEYANKPISEMSPFKLPDQPDGHGNCILDYIIESNDIEKFLLMVGKGFFMEPLFNDMKVLIFLIRNNRPDIIESGLRHSVFDHKSNSSHIIDMKFEFPILDFHYATNSEMQRISDIKYCLLNKQNQTFVDTILKCENDDILKLLPYKKIGDKPSDYPILFYLAIQKNSDYVLNYYIREFKKGILNQFHFDLAIEYNSTKCARLIFLLDEFTRRNERNLKRINNTRFINDCMKKYFSRKSSISENSGG